MSTVRQNLKLKYAGGGSVADDGWRECYFLIDDTDKQYLYIGYPVISDKCSTFLQVVDANRSQFHNVSVTIIDDGIFPQIKNPRIIKTHEEGNQI